MAAKSQSSNVDTSTTQTASISPEISTASSAVSQKRGNQAEQEKLDTAPGECPAEGEVDDTALALQLDALECYDFPGAVELALDHAGEPAAHTWLGAQDPATVADATPSFWSAFTRAMPDGGSVSVGGKLEAVLGLSQGDVKETAAGSAGLAAELSWMGDAFTLTAALSSGVGAGIEGGHAFLRAIGVDAASAQLTDSGLVSAAWNFTAADVRNAAIELAWAVLVSGRSIDAALGAMAVSAVERPPSEWRVENRVGANAATTGFVPLVGDRSAPQGDALGTRSTAAATLGATAAVGQDANGAYSEFAVSASGAAQMGIAQNYGLSAGFFSAFPPEAGAVGASVRIYADPVALQSGAVIDAPACISVTYGTTTESVMVERPDEARAWLAELTASLPDALRAGGEAPVEDAPLPEGGITRAVSMPLRNAGAIAPWVPEVAAQIGNFSGSTTLLDNSLTTSMTSKLDATVRVTNAAVDAALDGKDTGESRYAVASAIADTALGRPAEDTAANLTAGFGGVCYDAAKVTLELAGEAKITKEAMAAVATGTIAPLVAVAEQRAVEAGTGATGGLSKEANAYLNQKTTKVFDLTQRVPQVELPDVLAAAAK